MVRKTLEIALSVLLLLSLCGCGYGKRLGERAIVKMIYLDEAQNEVQAGLVVFTCAPSADTSSVEETAKLYTASGRSIEEAIANAEQKQNKKPFYAQNELLLLGPGTMNNISPYLDFFTEENAARPNLTVFLTQYDIDELSECEDTLSKIVYEGERMAADPRGQGSTGRIFELDTETSGVSGALPVYRFSKDESEYFGVKQLMLFHKGMPEGTVEDELLQLFLLLSGKTDRLEINTEIDGRLVSFGTQKLYLSRSATILNGAPHLDVNITGKLDGVILNGKPVKKDHVRSVAALINDHLEQKAQELNNMTFARGNDLFYSRRWMRLFDIKSCEALEAQGNFYSKATVTFHSSLMPA